MRQALAITGDVLRLSVRLKVPAEKLKNWLDGIEPVPDSAFLEAVDVVLTASADEQARSREAIRKPPAGKRP